MEKERVQAVLLLVLLRHEERKQSTGDTYISKIQGDKTGGTNVDKTWRKKEHRWY